MRGVEAMENWRKRFDFGLVLQSCIMRPAARIMRVAQKAALFLRLTSGPKPFERLAISVHAPLFAWPSPAVNFRVSSSLSTAPCVRLMRRGWLTRGGC
jgi:hypothetical protein